MKNFPKGEVLPPDDEVLVGRVQNGDKRAFQELYLRHARYVAGVVYKLLGEDADLDDIVQETFIAALNGIHRVKEAKHIRLFLVTIAVRRAKRRISKRKRRDTIVDRLRFDPTVNSINRNDEQLDQAYDILSRLPKGLRIMWMLHKVEGYTVTEVTSICGSSRATVKRRIKKADERIKRRLIHE
jgi:RNA polymerase sigma-70 factor (ECF subfamily)